MKKFALLLTGAAALALATPVSAETVTTTTTVSSEEILSEPTAANNVTVKETTTTIDNSGIIPKTTKETITETTSKQGREVITETTKVKQVSPANIVKTETLVTQKDIPNTNRVNLLDFDLDKDGVLTRQEIGEKLFYMFDTDGNMIIDNLELNRVGLVTLIPMEKTTIKMVDIGANGQINEKVVNTEEFLSESRLIAYDQNRDGLTPLEFIGVTFNRLDTNNDKAVDIDEWKDAYASYVKPKFQRQSHYN